jgi:hypothetical protein
MNVPSIHVLRDTAWDVVLPTGASESNYEVVKYRQKQVCQAKCHTIN